MVNEREIALQALLEFQKTGAWPDLYLKKKLEPLSGPQAALATNITYGVLQNRSRIDYYIGCFSSIPLKKISPIVLEAMRMAVYQILYLDRVPDSAAVNQSVELIKHTGNKRAAGFANGVLRTIVRQKQSLPAVEAKTAAGRLAIETSHPEWLVKRLVDILGEDECRQFLLADNAPVRPVVRINTLKTTDEAFCAAIHRMTGWMPQPVEGLENAFYMEDLAAALKSDLFEQGYFYVQDAASQMAVQVLAPAPGDRVLDICAAPGGKSLLAAQWMEDRGELVSNDLYPHKAALLRENARRYGVTILRESCKDACLYNEEYAGYFDKVICDVPCSGLGIIRKKPDIRYKDEASLRGLPQIQARILENAAAYLKPGGSMIYTTCTVLPEENEQVLEAFLRSHPDYKLCSFLLRGIERPGSVTLYPHRDGTDGFFISKLERSAHRCRN